jgi:hypothetical protein
MAASSFLHLVGLANVSADELLDCRAKWTTIRMYVGTKAANDSTYLEAVQCNRAFVDGWHKFQEEKKRDIEDNINRNAVELYQVVNQFVDTIENHNPLASYSIDSILAPARRVLGKICEK